MLTGLPGVLRRRQWLTLDELHHLIETGVDALVVVAFAEGRRDGFRDDAVGHGVGEHTLESVAHLDAHAMVVLGDEQQRAVIDPPATDCAPAELPLSTTLIEYCSISSGRVVGTMSTASCEPFATSKAASFCSSAPRWSAVSVSVRSVTRAVSGGTGCSPAVGPCARALKDNASSNGTAQRGPRVARCALPIIASAVVPLVAAEEWPVLQAWRCRR